MVGEGGGGWGHMEDNQAFIVIIHNATLGKSCSLPEPGVPVLAKTSF